MELCIGVLYWVLYWGSVIGFCNGSSTMQFCNGVSLQCSSVIGFYHEVVQWGLVWGSVMGLCNRFFSGVL